MTPPLVLVLVAGVRAADAIDILRMGAIPVVLRDFLFDPPRSWTEGLAALAGRLDALVVDGHSPDWQAAIDEARARGVPVFTDLGDLAVWIKARSRAVSAMGEGPQDYAGAPR